MRLLCNIERSRWRQDDYPQNHRKYVLVNVPSFHLDAIEGDSVLTMRMACGNVATKTPLLTSRIMRMDINPQWVVPRSIIRKEMVLKEFTIQAIDKGSDDVGKVHMQVEYDGHVYYGFGANTDIVTASVEAYIDCINKFKL